MKHNWLLQKNVGCLSKIVGKGKIRIFVIKTMNIYGMC